MHFLPSSLFSCRLKGLELSVSSPSSTHSTLYQLSGSAALIIIWPHLFGWLGELWFSFCFAGWTLLKREGVFILQPSACCISKKGFYDNKALLVQSCLQLCSFFISIVLLIKSWPITDPDIDHINKHEGRCDGVRCWWELWTLAKANPCFYHIYWP